MRYHSTIRQFNRRVIVSGKVIECYEYEKPVAEGFKKKRIGRAGALNTSKDTKDDNRKKTAYRARKIVRNTVNANPHLNKFLTLTFADNVTDLDYAHYEFDKFIKRLKTRFKGFQYVEVPEFQKRGAVHFHLLCNLPYVDVNALSKVWGHGFIKLNKIDNVDNVGAYITKYMTKENIDERLAGRKCYSMSKDLKQPLEYTEEGDIDELMENIEGVKRVYTSEFENDYYGTVRYTQVICTDIPPRPNPFRRWLMQFKGKLTFMLRLYTLPLN